MSSNIITATTKFKKGDLVIEQGTIGDCAFVIEDGAVEIVIDHPDGTSQVIATRGAGTIIGEMALIDKKRRTASIRAIDDCTMIKITETDFQRRLSASDPIMKMFTKVILGRYRDMIARVSVFDEHAAHSKTEDMERQITKVGKAIDHLKTANEFKHAIHNDELMLHYQPIIDLKTKQVKGFEALMRWMHPEKGFMPPNLFIPIAEDNGLIVEASDWAIRESAMALRRLKSASPTLGDNVFMSVNFTAIDMLHPEFLSKLLSVCADTKTQPHEIKIEMTERLLMNNPEKVQTMLQSCREAGFKIAIDDFGTGYSSLSYLHHYPIDTLKIDRSFVIQMTKDQSALNLVKGIINLAKSLNMELIAEGIEEECEEVLLLESNCEMAQGYKYSKPQAEDRLIEWLEK